MKKFKYLLATSCLLSILPLSAEVNTLDTEDFSIESYSEESENSHVTLQEELQLLDKEFEAFNEELFSLGDSNKETLQSTANEELRPVVQIENPERLIAEIQGEISLNTEAPATVYESLISEVSKDEVISAEIMAVEEKVSQVEEPKLIYFDAQETVKNEMADPVDAAFSLKPQEAEVQATITAVLPEEKLGTQEAPAVLNVESSAFVGEPTVGAETVTVDLAQAFAGAPIIYSLLLAMSVVAVSIWLYSLIALKRSTSVPLALSQKIHNKLTSNQFEEAALLCEQSDKLLSKMILSGIQARKHGLPVMVEAMKAEGKRASVRFWQKIGMLNDIAIIAPMLGLLGTVLGMFYAFYNINRSIESISTLFDGLGVSVGTTVAGLIVAILALILHSIAKYRVVRALSIVENEAQSLATLIDDRTSLYNKG